MASSVEEIQFVPPGERKEVHAVPFMHTGEQAGQVWEFPKPKHKPDPYEPLMPQMAKRSFPSLVAAHMLPLCPANLFVDAYCVFGLQRRKYIHLTPSMCQGSPLLSPCYFFETPQQTCDIGSITPKFLISKQRYKGVKSPGQHTELTCNHLCHERYMV